MDYEQNKWLLITWAYLLKINKTFKLYVWKMNIIYVPDTNLSNEPNFLFCKKKYLNTHSLMFRLCSVLKVNTDNKLFCLSFFFVSIILQALHSAVVNSFHSYPKPSSLTSVFYDGNYKAKKKNPLPDISSCLSQPY